jgi:hypothetical protein
MNSGFSSTNLNGDGMGKKQHSLNSKSIINAYYKLYVRETSNMESFRKTVFKIKEQFPQLSTSFIEEDLEKNGVENPFKLH